MRLIRLAARIAALPCQAILAVDDWLNPPQPPRRRPVAAIRYPDRERHHGRRVRRANDEGSVQTSVRRRA